MKIYSKSVDESDIYIIKGDAILLFSTPIIAGCLLNPKHRKKWDKTLILKKIEKGPRLSPTSHVMYISIKTRVFITYTDMVAIIWVYSFEDGTFLLGSHSIVHPEFAETSNRVRANCYCAMWYIGPNFDGDFNRESRVTYYTHISLGGSLPAFVVNTASVDIQQVL